MDKRGSHHGFQRVSAELLTAVSREWPPLHGHAHSFRRVQLVRIASAAIALRSGHREGGSVQGFPPPPLHQRKMHAAACIVGFRCFPSVIRSRGGLRSRRVLLTGTACLSRFRRAGFFVLTFEEFAGQGRIKSGQCCVSRRRGDAEDKAQGVDGSVLRFAPPLKLARRPTISLILHSFQHDFRICIRSPFIHSQPFQSSLVCFFRHFCIFAT